jgi:hypothetical protein
VLREIESLIPFATGESRILEQKYAEAEPVLREALGNNESTPREVWRRHNSQRMLGVALVSQRRYNEAEPMLVAGYEGLLQRRASMPADNRSALGQAAQWLVQLYQDWGKPEKAAEWRGNDSTGEGHGP